MFLQRVNLPPMIFVKMKITNMKYLAQHMACGAVQWVALSPVTLRCI